MQNGGIGGWSHIKRRLATSIAERWFMTVQGSTDSEWAFALFLDCLEQLGHDPASASEKGFGHAVLRSALVQTIKRINDFIAAIPQDSRTSDLVSLLNFAVTDGHSVVCSRYVGSKTDEAASLFFSSGTNWQPPESKDDKGEYKMERRDKGSDIVLVASEPLTFERDNWVIVPTNSTITIHNQTVMIHPIVDQNYNDEPSFTRSSKLVQEKGQISPINIQQGVKALSIAA